MIKHSQIAVAVLLVVVLAGSANAAMSGGQNWADSAYDYTSKIQNFDGMLMDASTEQWVTGTSDADVDGNGYAWDAVDNDHVGGWRANAMGEYIIVKFDAALTNITGDDLVIRMYGGGKAEASVWVKTNETDDFTNIGTIGPGTSGYLRDEMFDFDGLFADDVHYVKVLRVTNKDGTGMFFDSFASVPEPATMALLVCGGVTVLIRRRKAA